MLNGEEKFIDSAGLRIWTERFGNPGDPVVLLIMGTAAQGIGCPDELVEPLGCGRRQVIRFDHRDTGQSSIVDSGTISTGTNALSHLQDVEATENGRLFADAGGTIQFQDRHYRLQHSASPMGTIGDGTAPLPPGDRLRIDAVAPGQRPQGA